MNNIQKNAFKAAAGLGPDVLMLAIKSSLMVLLMIWATWVVMGTFKAWRIGEIELYDALWQVLRACISLLIVGFYIQ